MRENQVQAVIVLMLLGIHAELDVRKRKISLLLTAAGFAGGILWQLIYRTRDMPQIAASWIPGALFLILSYISRERVGYGDGFLLLSLGSWLGVWDTFLMLTGALILCSGCCIVLLLTKKAGRKDEVPFIPFMLISFVASLCI